MALPVRLAVGVATGLLAVGVGRLRPLGDTMAALFNAQVEVRARPLRVELRTRPPAANTVVVGRESDGTQHVLHGSLRVDVQGLQFRVADDRFDTVLNAAVRVRDGWVFVTDHGTVARADTFTGPLRVIGRVPCPVRVNGFTRGRMVFSSPDGAWSSTEGAAAPERLALPRPALSVAFVDGQHGAAALDGGGAALTADGGRTWQRVSVGPEAAWSVTGTAAGQRIATTGGMQQVTPGGVLEPAEDQSTPREEIWQGDLGALARAARVVPVVHPTPGCQWTAPVEVPHPASGRGITLACRRGPAPRVTVPDPAPGARPTDRTASAGLTLVARGAHGQPDAYIWRDHDPAGAYTGSARAEPALVRRASWDDPTEAPETLATTRAGAMVSPFRESAMWLWLPAGGMARAVPALWGRGRMGTVLSAVTQDWGAAMVELTTPDTLQHPENAPEESPDRQGVTFTLMELRGFDGTVRGRRAAAHRENLLEGTGRHAGRWGVVVEDATDTTSLRFLPVGTDQEVSLPWPASPSFRACTRPARADTDLVMVQLGQHLEFPNPDNPVRQGVTTLEIHDGAVCVRAVRALTQAPGEGFSLEALPDGSLAGIEDQGTHQHTVRCAPVAPVAPVPP